MGEETGLHLNDGHAGGTPAQIDCGDGAAGWSEDGDGEGAESDLVLLIAEGVAVAADVAEEKAKLLDGVNGAGGMGGEDDAGQVLLELLRRKVGKEDAAHAGAVGGQAAADVEVDCHDAVDGGASDVDDIVAVEGGDREGLAERGRHALEDRLRCTGESVGCGVGVGEGEHTRTEGVAGAVFRAGEAEFGEGVKAAADGGAGEAGANAELGDRHLWILLSESLDDDETSGEGSHKIRVTGEGVEGRCRSGLRSRSGWGYWGESGRHGGRKRTAGSKAQGIPFGRGCLGVAGR